MESRNLNQSGGHQSFKLVFVATFYIVLMMISNLLAAKLINVFGITLTPAVLVYPFCFMFGDILTEVYGFKTTHKVIGLAAVCQLLLILFSQIAILLPYPEFYEGQAAFESIFGSTPRIILGSITAYYAGSMTNSWVMSQMKKVHGQKMLWMRTIWSSVVGEVLDTAIFIFIAFYGTMPMSALITMLVSQYVIKIVIEAIGGTPLAYALIGWARR